MINRRGIFSFFGAAAAVPATAVIGREAKADIMLAPGHHVITNSQLTGKHTGVHVAKGAVAHFSNCSIEKTNIGILYEKFQ